MEVIKFKAQGIFNSYKIPVFRKYHKTFLAPPKTVVIGMLSNILDKGEKWYYEALQDDVFKVSIIIESIEGTVKDLWVYRTYEKTPTGMFTSIVRRDHLFMASYTFFIALKKDENISLEELYQGIKYPKKIPSLGLDDEIIDISDVKKCILEKNNSNKVDSVFISEDGNDFIAKIGEQRKFAIYPEIHLQPTKFIVEYNGGRRSIREPSEEKNIAEYLNCKLEFKSDKEVWFDKDENKYLLFY